MTRRFLGALGLAALAAWPAAAAAQSPLLGEFSRTGQPGVQAMSVKIETCDAYLCAAGESDETLWKATCVDEGIQARCNIAGVLKAGNRRYDGTSRMVLGDGGASLLVDTEAAFADGTPWRDRANLTRIGAPPVAPAPVVGAPPPPTVSPAPAVGQVPAPVDATRPQAVPLPAPSAEPAPAPASASELPQTGVNLPANRGFAVSGLLGRIPKWVPSRHGEIPEGALVAGYGVGVDHYVCRTSYRDVLRAGQVIAGETACSIGFGPNEVRVRAYDVLVGDERTYSWVQSTGGELPPGAVVTGSDSGRPLAVCRGEVEGFDYPGTVAGGTCVVGYDGLAYELPSYDVLVRNQR